MKIKTKMSEDGKVIKTKTKDVEHIENAIFKLEFELNGEIVLKKTMKNATIEEKKARLDWLKMKCLRKGIDYKNII